MVRFAQTKGFRAHRVLFAVGGQFWDVLVVKVFRKGHVGDVVVKIVVLDVVGRPAFLLLAVSFLECVFLWRCISVLSQSDHDRDK